MPILPIDSRMPWRKNKISAFEQTVTSIVSHRSDQCIARALSFTVFILPSNTLWFFCPNFWLRKNLTPFSSYRFIFPLNKDTSGVWARNLPGWIHASTLSFDWPKVSRIFTINVKCTGNFLLRANFSTFTFSPSGWTRLISILVMRDAR